MGKLHLLESRSRITLLSMFFALMLAMPAWVNTAYAQDNPTPTVSTDKDDYAPGETVYITGSNFAANEEVTIVISHIEPNLPDPLHDHDSWTVKADESGNFASSWYVNDVELNTTLYLTATGDQGSYAETTFTDAVKNDVSTIAISSTQSGVVTAGIVSPATYTITITPTGGTDAANTTLSLVGTSLPTGATGSFSTNPVPLPAGSSTPIIVTLIITNTITTPAGTTSNIQIKATGSPFKTSLGFSYVIQSSCTVPAISDQPLGSTGVCLGTSKTFTVTATGTAPLTYQWYRNGSPVGTNSNSYSIPSVAASDAGNYYVYVSNACGNATSSTVSLTMETTPPSLSGTPYSGTTLTNSCMAGAAAAAPFDATNAKSGYTDNCGGAVTAVLTGTNVTGNDCAWTVTYTFKVVDALGNELTGQTYSNTGGDKTAPSLTGTAYAGTTGTDACKANAESAAPFDADLAKTGYSDLCGGDVTAELTGTEVSGTDCAWTVTYTFKVVDGCGNELTGQTYSNTGSDQTDPTAVTKNISVYLGPDGTVSIAEDAVNDGSSDNCGGSVTYDTDLTNFDCEDVGDNDVVLTVNDACGNSDTEAAVVTVMLRPLKLTYWGDFAEQYSDQTSLKATLKDQLTNTALEGVEITFTLGSQSTTATTNASGFAEGFITINQAPGFYSVVASVEEDCPYAAVSVSKTFTILHETACAFYSGVMMASTAGVNSSIATVTLAATIVETYDGDDQVGDIRNANVMFFDGINPISGWIPVGLIDPNDPTTGTAVFEWTKDLGQSISYGATISIVIDNYYRNKLFSDCFGTTEVSIFKPGSEMITGGGYLLLDQPTGMIQADVPSKNNFGFNVKYNKKGTNLQGNINTIVRKTIFNESTQEDELHQFQVKGNALSSLAVDGLKAVFTGKANLQDVTDPQNPVSIGGNYVLQVTMTDNGEPGDQDMISITVFDKSGGVWFSSRWVANKPAEQILAGGNLKVHSAKQKVGIISIDNIDEEPVVEIESSILVYPNPSSGPVTMQFVVSESAITTIDIYSTTGQLVHRAYEGFVNGGELKTVDVQENLSKGLYLIHMRSGDQLLVSRLVVSDMY